MIWYKVYILRTSYVETFQGDERWLIRDLGWKIIFRELRTCGNNSGMSSSSESERYAPNANRIELSMRYAPAITCLKNACYHYWYHKSEDCWGWCFNKGHESIITLSLWHFPCSSYIMIRICTNWIDATIKMEVRCVWVTGKCASYRQRSEPCYYMVKYPQTGLKQIAYSPHNK